MSDEATLIRAIKSGNAADVSAILAAWPEAKQILNSMIVKDVAIEFIHDNGDTTFYRQDMSLLMLAMKHGYREVAQCLLKAGADVNHNVASSVQALGSTPLTVAIFCGQIDSAVWLIKKHKAPVEQADEYGNTPLHQLAALSYSLFDPNIGDIENDLVPIMLKSGASLDAKNLAGKTAVQICWDTSKFALAKYLEAKICKRNSHMSDAPLPSLGKCSFLAGTGRENVPLKSFAAQDFVSRGITPSQ